MPSYTIVKEFADKELGGNVIVVRFNDNGRVSVLNPGKQVVAEWYVPETGKIELQGLNAGSDHSRYLVKTLRKEGYPTAGKVLRK